MVQGPKSAHFPEHSVSILDFVLSMIELPHRNCSIAEFLSIIRQGLSGLEAHPVIIMTNLLYNT